tara:strand:- start:221 stop:433 length:213 start_codon:yes stop_codon:yes gene_type:complete
MSVEAIEKMRPINFNQEEFDKEISEEGKEMYRINEIYKKLSPEEKEKRLKMMLERQHAQLKKFMGQSNDE